MAAAVRSSAPTFSLLWVPLPLPLPQPKVLRVDRRLPPPTPDFPAEAFPCWLLEKSSMPTSTSRDCWDSSSAWSLVKLPDRVHEGGARQPRPFDGADATVTPEPTPLLVMLPLKVPLALIPLELLPLAAAATKDGALERFMRGLSMPLSPWAMLVLRVLLVLIAGCLLPKVFAVLTNTGAVRCWSCCLFAAPFAAPFAAATAAAAAAAAVVCALFAVASTTLPPLLYSPERTPPPSLASIQVDALG